MASTSVCICGESGSGKSTSLRNLNPEETFIITTVAKPLPFRGWKKRYIPFKKEGTELVGNYYICDKWDSIIKMMKIVSLKMPHIKNLIIDDLQYSMSFEFVDRATEKGYDKYSELAQHMLNIFKTPFDLRDDLTVVFLVHSENVGTEMSPKYNIKTLGKLLKEKVTTEGLFTCLLFTKVIMDDETAQYKFVTNYDGECIAKSPDGMFSSKLIDNDLNEVIKTIKAYDNDD